MTAAETCAHKACRCTKPYSAQTLAMSTRRVAPDATYCSDRCEAMAEGRSTGIACECGHPECTPQATPDIPPMQ